MEESIKLCTHEKEKFIALQLSLGFSKALQEDSSNSLPLASVPNDYALHKQESLMQGTLVYYAALLHYMQGKNGAFVLEMALFLKDLLKTS